MCFAVFVFVNGGIIVSVNVAINGFGYIGRLAFRQMFGSADFKIVAVNDLTDCKTIAHLLKYDSAQGRYDRDIKSTEDTLIVDGEKIAVFSEKTPESLPWQELKVDVVLECSGRFAFLVASSSHIKAGAKKVVISAPAGSDVPMVVFGVNENILNKSHNIISTGSCTTNCLAPMAKALNELAQIEKGFMTTLHAYTSDQNLLDAPHARGDLRRARSAANNIVPTGTNAAKAIGQVLPELSGKLDGTSQRVPVITGSLTELVAVVKGNITREQINEAMKATSNESFGYNEDDIVSSDIIGSKFGSLFDSTQTKVSDLGENTLVKVAAWYDNGNSYVSQMVRTIRYFSGI